MNLIFKAISRWLAQYKSDVCANMHRMASGWSGIELPQAPSSQESDLQLRFPLRRRQHLSWRRHICSGSH